MPLDYNDDAERVRPHSLLAPKPKKAGVVPHEDLKVLAKAMGVTSQKDDPKVVVPTSDSCNGGTKECVG